MSPQLPTVLLRAQSDDRLARLAACGSERAFEAIVERYRRPLLGYARRMLGDSRAEDVVQAALMGAWKQLQDGAEIRSPRAWLFRVVHNGAVNALKRASASDLPLLDGAPARGLDLQDQIENRETVRAALDEIAALPEQQRTALLAVCVQGRRHRDIGRELGVSEGAVRMLIHRARSTVRTAATALTPWPVAQWLTESSRVAELGAGGAGAGLLAGGTLKAAALLAAAGVAVTAGPPAVEAIDGAPQRSGRAQVAVTAPAPAGDPREAPAPHRRSAGPSPVAGERAPRLAAPIVPQGAARGAEEAPPSEAAGVAEEPAPAAVPVHAAALNASAPAAAADEPGTGEPGVDDDLISVSEDPADTAAGEQAIQPGGVPDALVPADTAAEIADEALANAPEIAP